MPEDRLPPAAEAFLERWGLTLESNAGHIRGIHLLAGELAALLDEVRAEERERCAAYLEGQASAIRAALKKEEPAPAPIRWTERSPGYYGAELGEQRLRVEEVQGYWRASLLPGGPEWQIVTVGEYGVLANAQRAAEQAAREREG
jgi:hypothetical protein